MEPYIIYSILALVFFSSSFIIFKLTAKHSMPNPQAYFFYYFLIYAILGLVIVMVRPVDIIPSNILDLKILLPYAIPIFVGIYCLAHAMFTADITVMAPIGNLGNVFVPVLAMLVLKESVSLEKLPWFLLIVLAGFLVSYNERLKFKAFWNKDVLLVLIFVFCISVTRIVAPSVIKYFGYWNFIFYEFTYMGFLGLLLLTPFLYRKIKISLTPVFFLALGVVFEFLGLLFMLKALTYQLIMPVLIVSLPLSSVITFIISRFNKNLLEDHSLKTYFIRFIAMGVMLFGIVMLAVQKL